MSNPPEIVAQFAKYFGDKTHHLFISCPVYSLHHGRIMRIGSSTYLGNGIFLTATHMLEGTMIDNSADIHGIEGNTMFDDFKDLLTIHLTDQGPIVWKAVQIHAHNGKQSDVALMVCEGADPISKRLIEESNILSHKPVIDFHIPNMGGHVNLHGYAREKDTPEEVYSIEAGTEMFAVEKLPMSVTSGTIEDFHESGIGRPSTYMYQVNAEAIAGMSGGCASHNGNIFGTVVSSIEPSSDYEKYTTFVSPLFNLLNIDIDIFQGYKSFYELCQSGAVKASGLEHIIMNNDGSLEVGLSFLQSCGACPYER